MVNYRSRKFLLALLVLVSSFILLWFGKLNESLYATLVSTTVAAYFAANVTQKATSKVNASGSP